MLPRTSVGRTVVRAAGPRAGRVDPLVSEIRQAHVARRDVFLRQWWTPEHEEHWTAERAAVEAGEDMIMSTCEVFDALMFARLDAEASRYIHDADRDDSRRWLVPGRSGGPLREIVIDGADLYDAQTGQLVA